MISLSRSIKIVLTEDLGISGILGERVLVGCPAMGEGGWEGVDEARSLGGGEGDALDHGDDVVAGCLNSDLKDWNDGQDGCGFDVVTVDDSL